MVQTNPAGANSIVWGMPVTGPTGKKGLSMTALVNSVTNGFGVQLEKQPEKMAKILDIQNWITSDTEPENYIFTYLGYKGVDWDYDAVGTPVRKEGLPSNYSSTQGGHTVMIRHTPTHNPMNTTRPAFREANKLDEDGYVNELLVSLPSAGIYQTEINKIEDEAYIAIITGERPLSYFDTFVAQWKSAGGDVLTKEANAWWDTTK
jgi:putative aldouronate transport system substrate-binding protein